MELATSRIEGGDSPREHDETDILNQRKKIEGEEKRLAAERKRQREIDRMYEQLNQKVNKDLQGKEVTFDQDGKIIQVKRVNEQLLPETVQGPGIKVRQAVVEGNYIKEALEKAKKFLPKPRGVDALEDQHKRIQEGKTAPPTEEEEFMARQRKKNVFGKNKVSLIQEYGIQIQKKEQATLRNVYRPMGSNFDNFQPK